MTTFFVILLVLILVNAALLIHSSLSNRGHKAAKRIAKQSEIKIYPIDLLPSDYKKAI